MLTNKNIPSAIVLAAGNSGRMGRLKAFLPFDDKQCFLEKIIVEFLTFGVQKLVVVLNMEGIKAFEKLSSPQTGQVQTVLNLFPERERFYSIQTALKALGKTQPVFIHNVDNPFVNREVLKGLSEANKKNSYVVPFFQNEGGHPILLSGEIVNDIVSAVDYSFNFRIFLQSYSKIKVPVNDNHILSNINTPEEYNRYFGK